MQITEVAQRCGWKLLTGDREPLNEVEGCYIGDLLSWVMAKAESGNIWLTVMGNVNAIAVAVLTDVSAIVLTENAVLDEDARARAELQGVTVYTTEENSYDTAIKIHGILNG